MNLNADFMLSVASPAIRICQAIPTQTCKAAQYTGADALAKFPTYRDNDPERFQCFLSPFKQCDSSKRFQDLLSILPILQAVTPATNPFECRLVSVSVFLKGFHPIAGQSFLPRTGKLEL
jgi:hypothetical protein